MKIAVVGDTHGKIDAIKKELQVVKPDRILFTGDYYSDAKRIAGHLKIKFDAVAGNCDPRGSGQQEQMLNLEGTKLYLVHGHQYGVKGSLNPLYYRGLELGVDAVLFGHTHVPVCEKINAMWMINPGSPSRPRLSTTGTYVLMELEKGLLFPTIIHL